MSISDPGRHALRDPAAGWFLPTLDEWRDAAYADPADPGCCDYPIHTNVAPAMAIADAFGDFANPGPDVANYDFGADWKGEDGHVTTVAGTSSPT